MSCAIIAAAPCAQRDDYNPAFPPGAHWSIDLAWDILDALPPGRMNSDDRTVIAALIAGTLVRVCERSQTLSVRLEDAKHGPIIPAGANPTTLGWYLLSCGRRTEGPFESESDARDALGEHVARVTRALTARAANDE